MPIDNLDQSGSHAKRVLVDDSDDGTDRVYRKRQRTSTENVKHGWLREPGQVKLSHAEYTVGWICALPIELAASHAMLDRIHQSLPMVDNDSNNYILGNIDGHNIAMVCLPSGQYGTNKAAIVASNMLRSFKAIRFGFMVGIGGGVPGEIDIRLGDVVVGTSVVQHDLGKITSGDVFQATGTPRFPPQILLSAVAKLRAIHEAHDSQVPIFLDDMLERYPRLAKYAFPKSCEDRLFRVTNEHDHNSSLECSGCSFTEIRNRLPRDNKYPSIHYGGIASGNQVVKCGLKRDQLAKTHNVICFEMEAAGLSDGFPCIVIRGICDYADSQKNKGWQRYAAATAAAYTRELLCCITSTGNKTLSGTHEKRPKEEINEQESYEDEDDRMQKNLERLIRRDERREKLLNSLLYEQVYARHATIGPAHSRTCEWLLQNSLYKSWRNQLETESHHGFLWISGKPGAGKSTIMKFAVEHESKIAQNSRHGATTLSFFFNARGSDLEKSTFGLYRTLLYQLLSRFPDLQSVFDDNIQIPTSQTNCPSKEVIQHLFRQAILALGRRHLTFFVDALDECDEEEVRKMVVYFEGLGEDAIYHNVPLRICLSSRPYPHVDIRHGLKLILHDQLEHFNDLKIYVQSFLRASADPIREKIQEKILQKANGVFMWVVLVVEILNKELNRGRWNRVERRLNTIPAKLSALFRDIIKRDNENMEEFLLCIQWILFASRPLTPKELFCAVQFEDSEGDSFSYDSGSLSMESLRLFVNSSSKGLAQVTQGLSQTVQFIHESVKDFLIKDNGFKELCPELEGDFENLSHEKLKRCCLAQITIDVLGNVKLHAREPRKTNLCECDPELCDAPTKEACDRRKASKTYPFLEYAVTGVLHHANIAAKAQPQDLFMDCFPLKDWIRLTHLFEGTKYCRYTPDTDLIYILAERDCEELLRKQLQHHPDIHRKGNRYGYPLFAAMANKHWTTARALLGGGADCFSCQELFPLADYQRDFDQPTMVNTTPLNWALEKRHEALAEVLIRSEYYCLTSRDRRGHSAFHSAAIGGNETLMGVIIDKVTIMSKEGNERSFGSEVADCVESALHLAISNGHGPIVGLVLERRVVPSDGLDGRIRVMEAINQALGARKMNKDLARVLLENNLAKDEVLFSVVVKHGYVGTVEFLMERGVPVDITINEEGMTALEEAIVHGHREMAEMLLEKGADFNHKDRSGRTPLHLYASLGQIRGVELLLGYGAFIDCKDEEGQTPLHKAAAGSHKDVVHTLINRGACIQPVDADGRTPVQIAVDRYDFLVVEMLHQAS